MGAFLLIYRLILLGRFKKGWFLMGLKLTEEQIELGKKMFEDGMTYYEISEHFKNMFDISMHPESIRYWITRKDKPKMTQVEKLEQAGVEKVLVLSDLHAPYHREDILDIVDKHKDEINMIILNGDIIDAKPISKFVELGRGSLIDEMASTHELLHQIDELTPNIRKVMTIGNHENRMSKYMASKTSELNDLHTDNILREIVEGFKKVDHEKGQVTYYSPLPNYEVLDTWYYNYNGMICCHPISFSKIPARTAYNAVEYFVRNGVDFDVCLVAHTHHLGWCKNLGKVTVETGCLCKPMDYASTGKLGYVPQDCGYHLAVFKDGKYDVNESRQIILY